MAPSSSTVVFNLESDCNWRTGSPVVYPEKEDERRGECWWPSVKSVEGLIESQYLSMFLLLYENV